MFCCHGRDSRRQLQPVGFALLAHHRKNRQRRLDVSRLKLPEPRRGAATLHARQQLVFKREREEGRDCSRSVSRFGGAHRRLFLSGGGTNQRHRIRVHRRGRKDCPRDRRLLPSRTTADSRAAGMVASQSVRWLWRAARRAQIRPRGCADAAASAKCRVSSRRLRSRRASASGQYRSRAQSLRRHLRLGLRLLRVLKAIPKKYDGTVRGVARRTSALEPGFD